MNFKPLKCTDHSGKPALSSVHSSLPPRTIHRPSFFSCGFSPSVRHLSRMPSNHNKDGKPWDTEDIDKWKVRSTRHYSYIQGTCPHRSRLLPDRFVQSNRQFSWCIRRGVLLRYLPKNHLNHDYASLILPSIF